MLWIDRPDTGATEWGNPLTAMAARLSNLADYFKIPMIAYFCELRLGDYECPTGQTREMQTFISLLYALINQAIKHLPPKYTASMEMRGYRFEKLDGSSDSVPFALGLFSTLMKLMPDPTYCVIDGLHRLDDHVDLSTEEVLYKFLYVLRQARLRVLFTTSGNSNCNCLWEKMQGDEYLSEAA